MIAIDTNILVRVLVNDPDNQEQCRLARKLVIQHNAIWISKLVLIETIWVLQRSYRFSKEQIIMAIEQVIQHPCIYLENTINVKKALELFNLTNVGFADCLILTDSQHMQATLYTFDVKLSRLSGTKFVCNEE